MSAADDMEICMSLGSKRYILAIPDPLSTRFQFETEGKSADTFLFAARSCAVIISTRTPRVWNKERHR